MMAQQQHLLKDDKPKKFQLGDWTANLRPHKTFRVAVSGDVVLNRLETAIVDTPEFQRLRTLRQLGLCHLVYPSAQHTRFEHLLGCVKKVERIFQAIRNSPREQTDPSWATFQAEQIARLAALLHDVGNVPLGHTLEDETKVLSQHQDDAARYDQFLAPERAIGKLLEGALGAEGCAALRQVLTTKEDSTPSLGDYGFICDVVKNTVCADLLDYLERDAYFCNLNIGVGDRFLRYLFIAEKDGARRLAVSLWKEKDAGPREDVVSELIQLLQARYYLAERVYFHHTKLTTSAMVGRAIWSALHPSKGKALNQADLLAIGDGELLTRLMSSEDTLARKLAEMLASRRLYKRSYTLSRSEAAADKKTGHLDRLKNEYHLDAANRTAVENELANLCGLAPGDVLLSCPDHGMNFKAANMLVTWANQIIPLSKIDEPLIKSKIENIIDSHRNLWSLSAYVHPERLSERMLGVLRDLCAERVARGDQPGPQTIERLLFEIAVGEKLPLESYRISECAAKLVSESRGKPPTLTRDYLRTQLNEFLSPKAREK